MILFSFVLFYQDLFGYLGSFLIPYRFQNYLFQFYEKYSPGQNTGVDSLSLLQGIFPTQGSNPGLLNCRQILYQLSHKGSQEFWSGQLIPSPGDLPDPGIEPGSPALQVDSLPTELSRKHMKNIMCILIEIALNMQIYLVSMDILIILPIGEHGISFHFFVSSSISFIQCFTVFSI